jgi:hypothetical protein
MTPSFMRNCCRRKSKGQTECREHPACENRMFSFEPRFVQDKKIGPISAKMRIHPCQLDMKQRSRKVGLNGLKLRGAPCRKKISKLGVEKPRGDFTHRNTLSILSPCKLANFDEISLKASCLAADDKDAPDAHHIPCSCFAFLGVYTHAKSYTSRDTPPILLLAAGLKRHTCTRLLE